MNVEPLKLKRWVAQTWGFEEIEGKGSQRLSPQ